MSAAAHTYYPDPAVIIATPNSSLRKQILHNLENSSVHAAEAVGGAEALEKLECTECQLLLLDPALPDLAPEELLNIIHQRFPGIDVLMLDESGHTVAPKQWRSADARELFQAISRWDGLATPASLPVEISRSNSVASLPGMVGESPAIRAVYRLAHLVAGRNTPVLITGPTGTGKEMVADAIHQLSPRADKPFAVLNCAAIPEALLESELFGYVRGAFTGAVQSHLGRIHSANGGTLFLDEISELPLGMQSKLLRFLDQGEVQRLGSCDVFRVDARVIAATNTRLEDQVRDGQFREDLFYRLSVFPIQLPPLSERGFDVELLARHFLRQLADDGLKATLSTEALMMLRQYSWPGNVRELQHVIERASILADGEVILAEHLPQPAISRAESLYSAAVV